MGFITDYLNLNQQLVRKLYPFTRIVKLMNQLEGFQHEIALDINMVYYIIIISPGIKDMAASSIVVWKFRYNHLLIGMCASGNIFQARVDKILSDIKGVKNYIDGILLLIKKRFSKHIDKLRVIFARVCAVVLKVNAHKYRFMLKGIFYLG